MRSHDDPLKREQSVKTILHNHKLDNLRHYLHTKDLLATTAIPTQDKTHKSRRLACESGVFDVSNHSLACPCLPHSQICGQRGHKLFTTSVRLAIGQQSLVYLYYKYLTLIPVNYFTSIYYTLCSASIRGHGNSVILRTLLTCARRACPLVWTELYEAWMIQVELTLPM